MNNRENPTARDAFLSQLKLPEKGLLLDDPTYFTSYIWQSLGANPIIFGNPIIRERLSYKLETKMRGVFSDSLDENGDSLLDHIIGKIFDIMDERIHNGNQPIPIERKGHEDLYEMVKSFEQTNYRSELFKGHEFIKDKTKILEMYNTHLNNHPNETYWYSGISIYKPTGRISFQRITDAYNRDGIEEEHYTTDKNGNVVYIYLYYGLRKDEIRKYKAFITTYNSKSGPETKRIVITFSDNKVETFDVYTRHPEYPFVSHFVRTLNRIRITEDNRKYCIPEGTEQDCAISLDCDNQLARLNELEKYEDSGEWVTFTSEKEMKQYYKLHKRRIDCYLKELGLNVGREERS